MLLHIQGVISRYVNIPSAITRPRSTYSVRAISYVLTLAGPIVFLYTPRPRGGEGVRPPAVWPPIELQLLEKKTSVSGVMR